MKQGHKGRDIDRRAFLGSAASLAASVACWRQLTAAPKPPEGESNSGLVLSGRTLRKYVRRFNEMDEELYPQHIPNAKALDFLSGNIPLLDCPDRDIERTYYYRWWTYRKHIKKTPEGFVITEFLPEVPWSGKYNTIPCPAGHHFYEGRWMHDGRYLDDYARFWLYGGGNPRLYSFWAADALYARYLANGRADLLAGLLDGLVSNYREWEASHRDESGLFWQKDGRDGMEKSISGHGLRPTINSYMFGDARAIARTAELAGRSSLSEKYRQKARRLKKLVQEKLWSPKQEFFEVRKRDDGGLAGVRELLGYTPWYVGLPDPRFARAWKHLMDPDGFHAPYGPTTAEQRHPEFRVSYEGHACQWNGPSWPYATAQTLTAMANLLNDGKQDVLSRRDYARTLLTYARSHRRERRDGRIGPWIDENLNPYTGDWIARTRLVGRRGQKWPEDARWQERGKAYNHSTFCDLVITGLLGLRPRADDVVEVNPLVPDGWWRYFCLDNIPYHGRKLTILWDRDGTKYGRGKGLRVYADGREIASSPRLSRVTGELPGTS